MSLGKRLCLELCELCGFNIALKVNKERNNLKQCECVEKIGRLYRSDA